MCIHHNTGCLVLTCEQSLIPVVCRAASWPIVSVIQGVSLCPSGCPWSHPGGVIILPHPARLTVQSLHITHLQLRVWHPVVGVTDGLHRLRGCLRAPDRPRGCPQGATSRVPRWHARRLRRTGQKLLGRSGRRQVRVGTLFGWVNAASYLVGLSFQQKQAAMTPGVSLHLGLHPTLS